MKKFVAMFTSGLLLCGSAFANIDNGQRVVDAKSFIRYENGAMLIPQDVQSQRTFSIDAPAVQAVFSQPYKQIEIKDFPVGLSETKIVDLKLSRPIFDANTKWTINRKFEVPAPNVISYYGKIAGEENSRITINYGDGEIYGVVERGDGMRYTIAPVVNQTASQSAVHMMTVDALRAQDEEQNFSCATEIEPAEKYFAEKQKNQILNEKAGQYRDSLLEVRVEIEGASTYFARTGGSGTIDQRRRNSLRYLHDLWAMVSRIYEDEINTTVYIKSVNLIDDPTIDEYPDMLSDGLVDGAALGRIIKYWNQTNPGNSNDPNVRHIGHVMMGPPNTGGPYVAGIARRDVLCDRSSCYSITTVKNSDRYPTMRYSDDASTVAHEVGHNFISPHTHDCGYWGKFTTPQGGSLDSCITLQNTYGAPEACITGPSKKPALGTIMSYCHLGFESTMQMTFGTIVKNVIRRGLDTNGMGGAEACLRPPAQPTVRIQYPYGKNSVAGNTEQVFGAGSVQTIRWTTSRVGFITLQYSVDSGAKWINIQENIPASNRKFDWTVPAYNSQKVFVRAFDPVTNTADTSYAVSEIRAKMVSVVTPAGGEKVPQKEIYSITWSSALIDSVKIEYSVDGGPWIQIVKVRNATSSTSNRYDWSVPTTINSQNVRIRITSTSEPEFTMTSNVFSIAPATASITNYQPGSVIRASSATVPSIVRLEFATEYVSKIRIEYSTDFGKIWTRAHQTPVTIDVATRNFVDWRVPVIPQERMDSVYLRILNMADQSEIYRVTPIILGIEDELTAESRAIKVSVGPNPVSNLLKIKISSEKNISKVEILIIGEDGRIADRESISINIDNEISFNTSKLSQGAYTLVLKTGDEQVSLPLQIVR